MMDHGNGDIVGAGHLCPAGRGGELSMHTPIPGGASLPYLENFDVVLRL